MHACSTYHVICATHVNVEEEQFYTCWAVFLYCCSSTQRSLTQTLCIRKRAASSIYRYYYYRVPSSTNRYHGVRCSNTRPLFSPKRRQNTGKKTKGRLDEKNRHGQLAGSSSIADKKSPPPPPLSTKSTRQPPKDPMKHRTTKAHGDAIEWVGLVYLQRIASYHCFGGRLSSGISLRLQGFQLSDSLPQPRNLVPVQPEKRIFLYHTGSQLLGEVANDQHVRVEQFPSSLQLTDGINYRKAGGGG